MKTITQPFRNLPLRQKLLTSVIPLIILTVGVTGFFSYFIASSEVLDKVRQSQLGMAEKTKDQLDYMAKDTLSFANYLFLNPGVQSLVTGDDGPEKRDALFKSLLTHMVTGDTIQSFIIYPDGDGKRSIPPFAVTQTGIADAVPLEHFQTTRFYSRMLDAPGQLIWDLFLPEDRIFPGDTHHKIVMVKAFKNDYDYKNNGVLVIGIDADQMSRLLFHRSNGSMQWIMNEQGTVLASTELSWIGRSIGDLPLPGIHPGKDSPALSPEDIMRKFKADGDYVVSDSVSDITGWHSVVLEERGALLTELDDIRWITFVLMGFFGLVMIILIWVIARVITHPLKRLVVSMRALQNGDFSQRVNFSGRDEISMLGHGYDTMVSKIKALIDDVYTSKLKQKEAELKALQSQINPHFLYNTLNMISWTAVEKGDKEISGMVFSLSQVFRLSLNSGKAFIDLQEEMELVRHYLSLQQVRYSGRLHFELETDPGLDRFRMPKLLLQPLVENAIVHAIEPAGGEGSIRVAAYREGETVVLEVTDNGPGMTEGELELLRQPTKPKALQGGDDLHAGGSGMALVNIRERLALFYRHAELTIHSKAGVGTRVQIRIEREDEEVAL